MDYDAQIEKRLDEFNAMLDNSEINSQDLWDCLVGAVLASTDENDYMAFYLGDRGMIFADLGENPLPIFYWDGTYCEREIMPEPQLDSDVAVKVREPRLYYASHEAVEASYIVRQAEKLIMG